jgi:predicted dehydrogenase
MPTFQPGYIQTGWVDVEDWGTMVVHFDDGSVAQITAADTVLGGIKNYLIVYGANAVVQANINPNTAAVAYAPAREIFGDEYISEKIETKAGWSFPAPDEDFMTGYPQEIEDFVHAVQDCREPLSGGPLARDVVATVYAAYLSAAEGRRVDLAPFLRE